MNIDQLKENLNKSISNLDRSALDVEEARKQLLVCYFNSIGVIYSDQSVEVKDQILNILEQIVSGNFSISFNYDPDKAREIADRYSGSKKDLAIKIGISPTVLSKFLNGRIVPKYPLKEGSDSMTYMIYMKGEGYNPYKL